MAAGLPGVGLSGVFFIISALVAVPLEIVRTVRGQSSLSRWATVSRHFAISILMIGALELFYSALRLLIAPASDVVRSGGHVVVHHAAASVALRTIPLLPILATIGILALVTSVAKAAELVVRATQRKRATARSQGA